MKTVICALGLCILVGPAMGACMFTKEVVGDNCPVDEGWDLCIHGINGNLPSLFHIYQVRKCVDVCPTTLAEGEDCSCSTVSGCPEKREILPCVACDGNWRPYHEFAPGVGPSRRNMSKQMRCIGGGQCVGNDFQNLGACNCAGTLETRCAPGYYAQGTACSPCPTGGTSDAGAFGITQCYGNTDSGTDETGHWMYEEKCYYQE